MSDVFAQFEASHEPHEEAARRFDNDVKEAVRLLMRRREGRVFVRWLIENEDKKAVVRRVMDYMEEIHV